VNTWLVDTGPLVAYLDASQVGHAEVVAKIEPFVGRLVTTSAVITEAMHFVGHRNGPRLLVDLLTAWDVDVYDFSEPAGLPESVALIERYANVPMDFADATLVLLAEAQRVEDVLTLDRRGFSTYRTRPGRGFRLVLDD